MHHYADTTAYRTEMEIVKAENDTLRQRVRALERALRARRRDSSQASRERESLGTESSRPGNMVGGVGIASPVSVAAWAANDGGVGGVAGPRERSESLSTTASSSRRGGTGLGNSGTFGTEEEVIRVGESAGSVGLGRGM